MQLGFPQTTSSTLKGAIQLGIGYTVGNLSSKPERDVLMQTFQRLEGRERAIMEMRYGLMGREERTQKEIADMMGISQSYISRLEKKILERMRREMSKLV